MNVFSYLNNFFFAQSNYIEYSSSSWKQSIDYSITKQNTACSSQHVLYMCDTIFLKRLMQKCKPTMLVAPCKNEKKKKKNGVQEWRVLILLLGDNKGRETKGVHFNGMRGLLISWDFAHGNFLHVRFWMCVCVCAFVWVWVHLPPHSVHTEKRGVTVSVHHVKVSWLKRRLGATIRRSLLSPATLHSGADACLGTETRVRKAAAGGQARARRRHHKEVLTIWHYS